MSPVYAALLHHPVRDRAGETVTTAVTTLDVHDIARSARTYGLHGYFVVSPIDAQRKLVEHILQHWSQGAGAERTPERGEALALCEAAPDLQQVRQTIAEREGRLPRQWATAARRLERTTLPFSIARETIRAQSGPILILFGTGHGLTDALLAQVDEVLEPIAGAGGDYNHLSVRSAAAVVFDRLLSF